MAPPPLSYVWGCLPPRYTQVVLPDIRQLDLRMGFISGMGVGTWWRMSGTRITVSALLGGIPAFGPFCIRRLPTTQTRFELLLGSLRRQSKVVLGRSRS